ncbi:AAA family ATPase [Pusillimonas sp. ANT_WB101]|uniref:AAA family ATPase n=1 Tax=Pusillimonas sp. ANT_WB101 TaxID=2597356 RepID=UPI0011EF6EA0|nr:AAA family ATPase [Pusillimonas sp. ANT_WB101]KAA0890663.1 AAA family ATPase [Pusillimonas sp. ANT_WB101]
MLKSLSTRNLTVFQDVELNFAPGLNVIVGENGCGKSHLLKVVYSVMAASAEEANEYGYAHRDLAYDRSLAGALSVPGGADGAGYAHGAAAALHQKA